MEEKIIVDLPDGTQLVAQKSTDPLYPGIYITVEGIKDDSENEEIRSVPTVLVEQTEGKLRALIWGDKCQEDYTHKTVFE